MDYETLIPSLELPDPEDRHVLAAALKARADVLVTYNLKDFPEASVRNHALEVWHHDLLLSYLLLEIRAGFLKAVRIKRRDLSKPPMSVPDFLVTL